MFFDRFIGLRIREEEYKQIEYLCYINSEICPKTSDFLRVAIMREIKMQKDNLTPKERQIMELTLRRPSNE